MNTSYIGCEFSNFLFFVTLLRLSSVLSCFIFCLLILYFFSATYLSEDIGVHLVRRIMERGEAYYLAEDIGSTQEIVLLGRNPCVAARAILPSSAYMHDRRLLLSYITKGAMSTSRVLYAMVRLIVMQSAQVPRKSHTFAVKSSNRPCP